LSRPVPCLFFGHPHPCRDIPVPQLRIPGRSKVQQNSPIVNVPFTIPDMPSARSRYKGSSRTRAVDALRGSTAAPSYFDEVEVTDHGQKYRFQGASFHWPPLLSVVSQQSLPDGGICCNNPTGVAIHEAKALWPNYPISCVVSLGTGKCKKVLSKPGSIQGAISTLIERYLQLFVSCFMDRQRVFFLSLAPPAQKGHMRSSVISSP